MGCRGALVHQSPPPWSPAPSETGSPAYSLTTGFCEKTGSGRYSGLQRHSELNVKGVAAGERFLSALKDVADPERKREIIGREFMRFFSKRRPRNWARSISWFRERSIPT